jgi:hypothetical protein
MTETDSRQIAATGAVEIELKDGRSRVVVDGVDVAPAIEGLRFDMSARPGDVPRLVLAMRPRGDHHVVLPECIVVTEPEEPGGDEVLRFLNAMDPDEVDRLALENADMGDYGGTRLILDVLKKLAGGG